jgi:hypothetical protein
MRATAKLSVAQSEGTPAMGDITYPRVDGVVFIWMMVARMHLRT